MPRIFEDLITETDFDWAEQYHIDLRLDESTEYEPQTDENELAEMRAHYRELLSHEEHIRLWLVRDRNRWKRLAIGAMFAAGMLGMLLVVAVVF